jgi:F420-dependent oxidoreductase-like protein
MTTVGFQIPRFAFNGTSATFFASVRDAINVAEAAGFDTAFVMDHFFQLPQVGKIDEPMPEAYSLLSGIAAVTKTIRLSTLVTGVTYRNPALLAKTVTTLDIVSGGRAMLGIGAAWFEAEHQGLGYSFPPLRERFERLSDALHICRAMFDSPQSSFEGFHHRIEGAWNIPRPVQDHVPILVGGTGETKTFRLAAEHADFLNINSSFAELPGKLAALQGHLDALGRDRSTISVSCLGSIVIAETAAEAERDLADLLRSRGIDPGVLANPETRANLLPRMLSGSPDQIAAQVQELRTLGMNGVVVNIPHGIDNHDRVRLAGQTLRSALSTSS